MNAFYMAFLIIVVAGTQLLAEVNVRNYTFIGGDSKSKDLYMQQKYKFWGTGKYPKNKDFKGQLIVLANSKTTYALWMPGEIKDEKWITTLGMRAPSNANWYVGGFFKIISGKFNSDKAPAEIKNISQGESGSFSICWKNEGIEVETTIILPDNEDKLLISTKLVKCPDKIKSYIVVLMCYPSSFGGGWKQGLKLRKRAAMTSVRELNAEKGPQKVVLGKKEMWCLLYDNYFDAGKNRGEGPCGFLFNPADTAKTILTMTNYACSTSLVYDAKKQSDIILWDFNKMTNQQAIEYMKSLKITTD